MLESCNSRASHICHLHEYITKDETSCGYELSGLILSGQSSDTDIIPSSSQQISDLKSGSSSSSDDEDDDDDHTWGAVSIALTAGIGFAVFLILVALAVVGLIIYYRRKRFTSTSRSLQSPLQHASPQGDYVNFTDA